MNNHKYGQCIGEKEPKKKNTEIEVHNNRKKTNEQTFNIQVVIIKTSLQLWAIEMVNSHVIMLQYKFTLSFLYFFNNNRKMKRKKEVMQAETIITANSKKKKEKHTQ